MNNVKRINFFKRDGLTFNVIDKGPIDGEVAVLLHGFPQRASSWSNVMKELNKAGYRTIAPDQRGYSPEARPKGRYAYRVSELAMDVVELIKQLITGPVHLVGHDWGSFVGWTVAGKYPKFIKTWTSVSLPHPKAFVRSLFLSKQSFHSWYMLFFSYLLYLNSY
ncbi:alpha/beta fold hydrolase [Bacillus sp. JK74]|uniref:alpha/beta fold hydrolase n=1 Tax=Bacillus siamensis TaxID=659243 RepID=UPI00066FF3CD|nr:alpha/beta fold hydrolase [Bacillus siamensis]OAZ65740.1 Soluble epoxide hydrolase [Bacillus siamensis]